MTEYIKEAAKSVGIVALITNTTERLETQLNSITRDEDSPIMLVAWNIDTNLTFDTNGFLENPTSNIVALLVKAPEDQSKDEAEKASLEMAVLYQSFIQALYKILIPFNKTITPPITSATYKLVPKHGAGKHSGVLCKWTQKNPITLACTDG